MEPATAASTRLPSRWCDRLPRMFSTGCAPRPPSMGVPAAAAIKAPTTAPARVAGDADGAERTARRASEASAPPATGWRLALGVLREPLRQRRQLPFPAPRGQRLGEAPLPDDGDLARHDDGAAAVARLQVP